MDNIIDHIGWLTENIEETANVFSVLGFKAGPIVNDETQRCRICFRSKKAEL